MRLIACIASCLLVVGSSASAQPACVEYRNSLELVGATDIPINAQQVIVRDDFAFVCGWGSPAGFLVVDISRLDRPVPVSELLLHGNGSEMVLKGDHIFLAEANGWETGGLRVIDVSNPRTPVSVALLGLPSSSYTVAVVNDTVLAVAGEDVNRGITNVHMVSIASPAHPVLIGALKISYGPRKAVVEGHLLYVTTPFDGMFIIDVADPRQPVLLSSIDLPGLVSGVALVDGYAFVASGHKGIQIVDISNPLLPVLADSVSSIGSPTGLFIRDETVFVGNYDGLEIFDASDPLDFRSLGSKHLPGYTFGVTVRDGYAFLASYGGLQIVRIDDLEPVEPIGFLPVEGSSRAFEVTGTLAYLADGLGRLSILEVSDPEHVIPLGTITTGESIRRIRSRPGRVVLLEDTYLGSRLVTVNVSDPLRPVVEGALGLPKLAADFAVAGNYAYVGYAKFGWESGPYGVQIVDLTDPHHPRLGRFITTRYDAVTLEVVRDRLYVGCINLPYINDPPRPGREFIVMHLRSPGDPVEVATLDEGVFTIIPGDNVAYLGTSDGFKLLDGADPANPVVTRIPTNLLPIAGAVSGNVAYMVDGWELWMLDVSQPLSPVVIGRVEPTDRPWNMGVSQGVPLLMGSRGMTSYPPQCGSETPHPPAAILGILPAIPNPTRSGTRVDFLTSRPGEARLRVLDVLGRIVVNRSLGSLPAGLNVLLWDGNDSSGNPAANGVYFLEITLGGESRAGRVAVVR